MEKQRLTQFLHTKIEYKIPYLRDRGAETLKKYKFANINLQSKLPKKN